MYSTPAGIVMTRFLFVLVVLQIFICSGCADKSATTPEQQTVPVKSEKGLADGTAKMVSELSAIASNKSNINLWHLNKERAMAIDAQLASITDPGQHISMTFKAGLEWLNAGELDTAAARITSIFDYIKSNNLNIPAPALKSIKELLGVVFLRKGEIENCIANHNAYSCILPIDKQGQHINTEGSKAAVGIFEDILSANVSDDNIQTKWLYNIAQMTLGKYPDKISKPLLIEEQVFNSEAAIPRFTDMAMQLGLAVNDISGSVVMEDFNNDHYLDFMVSSYGLDDQLRYYQNDRRGGFVDKTNTAGLKGLFSGLNMVQADYNNDGWTDVLVLRGAWLSDDGNHPNSLLRNNGDGTFSDVTVSAGLYSLHPTQTASWADVNNDGWLDLFIGNEYSKNNTAVSELYISNGDGTFSESAANYGLSISVFIKGCIFSDYDNDGDPDLYVSVINGSNKLYNNGGAATGYKFIVKRQLGTVDQIKQGMSPMMLKMAAALEDSIDNDLPFNLKERKARMEDVKNTLVNPDVSPAEQYRRVLNAFKIEVSYGQGIDSYEQFLFISIAGFLYKFVWL